MSRITVTEASEEPRTGRIFGSSTRTGETYRLNQRGQSATLGEGNIGKAGSRFYSSRVERFAGNEYIR